MFCGRVQFRFWRRLSVTERGQQVSIFAQQRVDKPCHLPTDAPDNGHGSLVLAGASVPARLVGKQAVVEVGPFRLLLDGSDGDEVEGLLDEVMPALFEGGVVEAGAGLELGGRPTAKTSELAATLKVGDVARVGQYRCCGIDPDTRKGEQDTPGAILPDQHLYLAGEGGNVAFQQGKLGDELALLGNESADTVLVTRADAGSCQFLQSRIGSVAGASEMASRNEVSKGRLTYGFWRWVRFTQGERGRTIDVREDSLDLWKEFVSDSRQLVLALRRFALEFGAVLHERAQERGCGRRRQETMHALGFVQHRDAQLDLVVEEDGEGLRVALIRLLAGDVFAHVHAVDGDAAFVEILFEGRAVVAGALNEDAGLFRPDLSVPEL